MFPNKIRHVAGRRSTHRVTGGGLKSDAYVASGASWGSQGQPDGVIEDVTFWLGFIVQVGIMKAKGTEKMVGPP